MTKEEIEKLQKEAAALQSLRVIVSKENKSVSIYLFGGEPDEKGTHPRYGCISVDFDEDNEGDFGCVVFTEHGEIINASLIEDKKEIIQKLIDYVAHGKEICPPNQQ